MSDVNLNGTYTTEDGNYVLVINGSDAKKGTFGGTYRTEFGPQGPQEFDINGGFMFVSNPGDGRWPLSVQFTAIKRHEEDQIRRWVIRDLWVGSMSSPDKAQVVGTRGYVPAGGVPIQSCLGDHTFVKEP